MSFTGEISLRGEKRPTKDDGLITKGNVYLDGHPICDDGWTREDATVACRWNCFGTASFRTKANICRMLGYAEGFPEWGSVYGPASVYDVFKLTDLNCNGKEESLEDCFYRLYLGSKHTFDIPISIY